jgi:hypothetical protein
MSLWPRPVAWLLLAGATGCGGGSLDSGSKTWPFPKQVPFEGVSLSAAAPWGQGKISGLTFLRPGSTLPDAQLQIGVIASSGHASGTELHEWVSRQRTGQTWFHSATADESCVAGMLNKGGTTRTSVALTICRSGQGSAACAEADQALDERTLNVCMGSNTACWEELCTQQWMSRRAPLEGVVQAVLAAKR